MTAPTTEQATEKAATLIEALPYIRTYRGQTVVVKIGGQALEDPQHAAAVAEDLALLSLVGVRLVVVHGGGPQVSAAMEEAGIEPRFIEGLRVTDAATIEVAQRVLVGSINSGLVRRLNAAGLSAVGLTGNDGAAITVEKAEGPAGQDLGYVGRISAVRSGLLESLLEQGYTPVLASIAPDASGAPHNVNADAVAGAVASELRAAKLVFLTNVEGLYRDLGDSGSLVSEIKAPELRALLPSLSEGMRPKMTAALEALDEGVGKSHILDGRVRHALLLEVFTDQGIGTQVLP